MSGSAADVAALVQSLPRLPFAQVEAEGGTLVLIYEGRRLAAFRPPPPLGPLIPAANQALNALAHGAIWQGGLEKLPHGEAVNAVHQITEWWDGAVCALARR